MEKDFFKIWKFLSTRNEANYFSMVCNFFRDISFSIFSFFMSLFERKLYAIFAWYYFGVSDQKEFFKTLSYLPNNLKDVKKIRVFFINFPKFQSFLLEIIQKEEKFLVEKLQISGKLSCRKISGFKKNFY